MATTARSIFCFSATRLLLALLAGALSFGALAVGAAPTPQAGNATPPSRSISVAAINPSVAAAMPAGGIAFPVEVTITGQNFRPGVTVMIGPTGAGIVSATATEIHATIPGEPAGAVDVVVANPDGTSITLPKAFTYTTGPVVYGVSPQTGNAAEPTVVMITGGNFASDSTITVGGLATPILFLFSATSLEAQVPANPAVDAGGKISGAVTVTNSDGQSFTLPNAFTWSDARTPSPAPSRTPSAAPTSSNQAAANSRGGS
jgi:IPT/TIG domain-containing protein